LDRAGSDYTESLHIRVDADLKKWLTDFAQSENMDVSTAARVALEAAKAAEMTGLFELGLIIKDADKLRRRLREFLKVHDKFLNGKRKNKK